jgi:flagellar biosynthetic protein FliR
VNYLFDLVPVPWATAVLLLSLRIGAMLLATPLFSAADVPVRVRVLVVLGLSIALCAGLGLGNGDHAFQRQALEDIGSRPGALLESACTELALGIVMSLAIHAAFSAFAVAGALLDVQLGFGLSQVFDPASNAASTVLTTAFNRVAVVCFFILNGHHALIRAIAFSLERVPLGSAWSINAAGSVMLVRVAFLFGLCVALAAPIIFCILLTELALGVLARNLPQVNMLTMGLPVKVVVGLAALCLWFTSIGSAMDRVYRYLYESMSSAVAALPGMQVGGSY